MDYYHPNQHARFEPYVNNGGCAVAVSPPGSDFVVIAADTRISTGYAIHTRDGKKIFDLTSKCVLATSGMQADIHTLQKLLRARMQQFVYQHRKEMPTTAIAQMLSNTLYYKRFFPYYTFNIIGGLDEKGEGYVYGYDAVGSFQRVPVVVQGTGHELIQPILDNQIERKHQHKLAADGSTGAPQGRWQLSELEAVELVKDCFTSAGERDIYTGDHVDICVINKNGMRWERFDLKQD